MPTPAPTVHISVCVCTFKRPALLARLLDSTGALDTNGRFTYSVVVVDNDRRESARSVVESFAAGSGIAVKYCVEPEQNIARARNRAIAEAEGELVALVDDDEFPGRDWLLAMIGCLQATGAQGVLGPVKPHFEARPPAWVVRGGFCERPCYPTGTALRLPRQTRTGNCLLRRSILLNEDGPFDPRFGRTGGEDVDFFGRRLLKGDLLVWCDEAPVFESVPAERMTRGYFVRRALLRGVANAEKTPLLGIGAAKSLVAALAYTTLLPALLLWRHDVFMHCLVRDCDHIGTLFALIGVRLARERPIT
jgi:succinoglycan biosynthesis protein ExoM